MVEHNLSVVAELSDPYHCPRARRNSGRGDIEQISKAPEVIEAYIGAIHRLKPLSNVFVKSRRSAVLVRRKPRAATYRL